MAQRLLLIVFLLLSAANLFIFLNRDKGYQYVKQEAYHQLYPNISKGIASVKIEQEKEAVIDLKGYSPTARWTVECNDSVLLRDHPLPLRFVLKESVNSYVLKANDSVIQPIVIYLDYSPAALYQKNGSNTATNYEIRYSSEPLVTADSSLVTKWTDRLDYVDASALKMVKQLLADSLHIQSTDSTEDKIKAIGNFIYRAIHKQMGIPPDSLTSHSAYEQFCLARDGKTKIWCANITDIFHLFSSAAGIVSRKIGFTGQVDVFNTGLHSANECYIPEKGEWAYVDITQNILLLTDSSGNTLNAADIYHLKRLNETGDIILYSSTDSAVNAGKYLDASKKYIWKENEILYPYPYTPGTLYSWYNKLTRYVSPTVWFEIYSQKAVYSNSKFYLRLYAFYSWLAVGLLLLICYLFGSRRRSRSL